MARKIDSSSSAQKPSGLLGLLGTLAFVFVVWLLSLGAPDEKSEESKYAQKSRSAEDDNREDMPSMTNGTNVNAVPPPNRPPRGAEGHNQNNQRQERQRTPLVQWLIFGVTAIYATITLGIYCQTKVAAKAAQDAADVAAKQMVLDMRPWVGLTIDGTYGGVTNDNRIGMGFWIANPGKTPAVSATWECFDTLAVKPKDGPPQFIEPRYEQCSQRSEFPYMLSTSYRWGAAIYGSKVYSATQVKQWTDQKLLDELAIRVTYKDVIDVKQPVHTTEVCIYVMRGNGFAAQCPAHNFQN